MRFSDTLKFALMNPFSMGMRGRSSLFSASDSHGVLAIISFIVINIAQLGESSRRDLTGQIPDDQTSLSGYQKFCLENVSVSFALCW